MDITMHHFVDDNKHKTRICRLFLNKRRWKLLTLTKRALSVQKKNELIVREINTMSMNIQQDSITVYIFKKRTSSKLQ